MTMIDRYNFEVVTTTLGMAAMIYSMHLLGHQRDLKSEATFLMMFALGFVTFFAGLSMMVIDIMIYGAD